MWKSHCYQFDWAHKLDGVGPSVIIMAGLSIWARLMETQMWCRELWLCVGEGSEKVQGPLSAVLFGRKLSPSSRPDTRHFSSSPYATGALKGAAPVLEARGSESESIHVQGPPRGDI